MHETECLPSERAEELLELYALARLPGSEASQFETHLAFCGRCQVKLAEMQSYIAAMKMALAESEVAPPVRRPPAMAAKRTFSLARPIAGYEN